MKIGYYKVGKTLGMGSFGKVKLAEHEPTGKRVAIKILNREKIKSLDMEEKVKREIRILKMLSHPHIIQLYEVIETTTDVYVVTEVSSGGELFDFIVERGRLSEDDARRFFQQIISGVEHCHKHMVAHRDLKPENLLLDEHHNVKIADFGLSNCMRDGWFLRTSCGSPNYAAPEVISGKLYAGPEVDVWSCGVIVYALLCGTLPFDDESIPFLFRKIKGGIYILPAYLSENARDLISKMLVVEPLKRITMAEIRQHPWFLEKLPRYLAVPPALATKPVIDERVLDAVVATTAFARERVVSELLHGRRNYLTAAYHLLKKSINELDLRVVDAAEVAAAAAAAASAARGIGTGIGGGGGTSTNDLRAEATGASDGAATADGKGAANGQVSPASGVGASGGGSGNGGAEDGRGGRSAGPSAKSSGTSKAVTTPSPASVITPSYQPRRRWSLGVTSHLASASVVMAELYRALAALRWKWKTPPAQSFQIRVLVERESWAVPVRLCLQLFKYGCFFHVDLHRLDGDLFPFIKAADELMAELRL
eukprot:TRINITY_DN2169_c0_g1_i3.p1 TRINITY_DN2169_c0_g1~~TRINITY_DN2169_c0_g1_i3.p1  ORF type:complete len:538 (-),score=152.15 TRINITY_DN2169_c0_g1_i3:951-2564(-)